MVALVGGSRIDGDERSQCCRTTADASGSGAGVRVRATRTTSPRGCYCIDGLDQLVAATAAIDSIALLILRDHINPCIRDALDGGDADERIADLVTAVRRCVGSR